MKIKNEILEDFLKKTRMGEVDTCLLEFKEDGLHIDAATLAKTHKCVSFLKKESFEEYAPIGNVGVDDLGKLIGVFKRLGKELEFEVEGNMLQAKGPKKELRFELVDEKFIKKSKDLPDMKHDTTFTIPATNVADFLKDVNMNVDASIIFETVDGGVKLYNTGKYKFTHNFDSEGTKAGSKAKFGPPIINAIEGINKGDMTFHIKSDYPLLVDYKTDNYEMTFLVAPRVEN